MIHRNWKKIFIFALLIVLALLLTSCTGEQVEDAGELVLQTGEQQADFLRTNIDFAMYI